MMLSDNIMLEFFSVKALYCFYPRQLCKPKMKSRDCIVLENSPVPVTVYTDHTMHERQKGTTLKNFKVTP